MFSPDDRTVKEADVVIFRLNKSAGEKFDIPFEEPVEELRKLREVIKLNKNVIVLINSCNTMPMDWIGEVKGVLWCYYLGQERGDALANIINGKVSPSGKLPFTIERSFDDSPSPEYNFLGGKPFWYGDNSYKEYWQKTTDEGLEGFSKFVKLGEMIDLDYDEGIFVGYRWFDRNDIPVVFPFGFGLSYTKFEYSNLKVRGNLSDGGKIYVIFNVKNVGKVSGKEVIQLYVSDEECSVERPKKELKGFDKIELSPNEMKKVEMELDFRSFAFWDVKTHTWKVEEGDFMIKVGGSSTSLPLMEKIRLEDM